MNQAWAVVSSLIFLSLAFALLFFSNAPPWAILATGVYIWDGISQKARDKLKES